MKELFSATYSKRGYLIIFFAMILTLNAYLFSKYRITDVELKQVSFITNINPNDVLVYVYPYNSTNIGIIDPIKPEVKGDTLSFQLDRHLMRNFRIYIGREINNAFIRNLTITGASGPELFDAKEWETKDLMMGKINSNNFEFSSSPNGYLSFKKQGITKIEVCVAELCIFIICIPMCLLFCNVFMLYVWDNFKTRDPAIIAATLFILTIFLPEPICNVLLILGAAIGIRKFNWSIFTSNKAGPLCMLYFLSILISNIFISTSFYMLIIETTLPIFILPFYFSSLPRANYLRLFVVSALFISMYFIATSFIDLSIYKNIDAFSFDSYAKYIHPVYVSYLMVFCMMYLFIKDDVRIGKKFFYIVFIVSLLCCGSKLMILLAVLFFTTQLFRKRILLALVFLAIVLGSILLFSPTRKRFQEIVNAKSLSILRSYPIEHNDTRLTGLTLRLLIWQETLNSLETPKDVILGKGVDENANELLKENLKHRGIRDQLAKYDPHNQFLTTLYKTGLIGLFALLVLCVYIIKLALDHKDKLFLWTGILFVTAMMAESVMQRVLGIYFFVSIILLQSISLSTRDKEA